MFRRVTPALALLLAACASETRAPVDTAPPPSRPVASEHDHGRLVGLSVPELGELFGSPALQVREGPGLKLQYRGGGCVLDTYLYAPESGQGVERVTHAEARLTSGVNTDTAACEAQIERKR